MVGRIVEAVRKEPGLLKKLTEAEHEKEATDEEIRKQARHLDTRGDPIRNADHVKMMVKVTNGLEVKPELVRNVLRKDLGFRYRRVRRVPPVANSERC